MKTQKTRFIGASAMLVAAAGATVSAVDLDGFPGFTNQSGQYDTTMPGTLVRGTGASYDSVRVTVPIIFSGDNAFFNVCAVQADPADSSRPLGSVTTGSNVLANTRAVIALGTTDIDFPGGSMNAFIGEGNDLNSNATGTLLPDGTLVWREAFSSEQNNLGYEVIMAEPQTPIAMVGDTAANLLWGAGFPGVGNGMTVTAGSVFTGTPGAARNDQGQLFIGNTNFDGFTGHVPRGCNVWAAQAGGVSPNATVESWLQDDTIGDLLPDEEANANGIRQTQPHLQRCVDPDSGGEVMYALFGVGISGGVNLGGGSAVPRYFVVDSATAGDGYANAVFIEADNNGPSGDIMNTDINNTNPAFGFIDHQATGGGAGPFVNSQFDMNESGDVVALWEDTSGSITKYEIRLWKAVWSGGVITGYEAPVTIAESGMDGIEENVQDTVNMVTAELIPMTGPAIDNDGRIAFVALTEAIYDPAAPMGMPDLIGSTNSVMVWEPTTATLHVVARGGTNGDVLADSDPGNAAGGNLSLEIGTLPIDPQGTSDAFSRASLSDEGGFIAVNFRSGAPNDPAFGGGVLFNPNMPADTTDVSARGTMIIELGDLTVAPSVCVGDCDGNGTVEFNDLVSMLFEFGNMGADFDCDADMSGTVGFNDLVAALFLFGPCP